MVQFEREEMNDFFSDIVNAMANKKFPFVKEE